MIEAITVAAFLVVWLGTAFYLDSHHVSVDARWPLIGIGLQLVGFLVLCFTLFDN